MYTDDNVLLGDSPADLQQLIDALSGFCAALGLDASFAKTQIMCFGLPPDTPRPAFAYAGRTLPHADSYIYPGTTFTPAGAAGDGLPQLRSSVGNAFHSVRFRYRLGCASSIHLQLHLYDAIVTATALSSCEGVGRLPVGAAAATKASGPAPRLRPQHLPSANGVHRGADGGVGQEARWLAHSLRFWNSLCAQLRGSLHYELLMDAHSEALLVGTRNWVWGLAGCSPQCGESATGWGTNCRSARSERGASTCNVCWACGQRSSSGHGRSSACALGRAGPRVQLSARRQMTVMLRRCPAQRPRVRVQAESLYAEGAICGTLIVSNGQ